MPEFEGRGGRGSGFEVAYEVAKFDLQLELSEQDGQIVGGLSYATDLFEEESIDRQRGYLLAVLEAMVADGAAAAVAGGDAVRARAGAVAEDVEPHRRRASLGTSSFTSCSRSRCGGVRSRWRWCVTRRGQASSHRGSPTTADLRAVERASEPTGAPADRIGDRGGGADRNLCRPQRGDGDRTAGDPEGGRGVCAAGPGVPVSATGADCRGCRPAGGVGGRGGPWGAGGSASRVAR